MQDLTRNTWTMKVLSLLEPATEALPDSKSKPPLATLITAVVGILVEYSQSFVFVFVLFAMQFRCWPCAYQSSLLSRELP